jgi:hypothetical protein
VNPTELTAFGEVSTELADAIASSYEVATSNKPKLAGVGLYLEAHATEHYARTTQVFITPSGKNEKGELVSMAVIYRTISELSPRAQWRTNFVRNSKDMDALSPEDKAVALASRANEITARMFPEAFVPRSRPIAVELTSVDYNDISEWKVPASALRRIIKARVEVGFPENLY